MPSGSPAPDTMHSLLVDTGSIVTKCFGWIKDVADTIVGNPILLITTGFLVLGGCIALFGRLLSKG